MSAIAANQTDAEMAAQQTTHDLEAFQSWPSVSRSSPFSGVLQNNPVLFLDDQAIFALLAQTNACRIDTRLVGILAASTWD